MDARARQLPANTTMIDGTKVHFLHVRSPEPNALPLIMTHCCPGSSREAGRSFQTATAGMFREGVTVNGPSPHAGDQQRIMKEKLASAYVKGPVTKRTWNVVTTPLMEVIV
jgi:epoxide hydrolase-like protein